MPRTVSIEDAKAELDTLITWVTENQDVVILAVGGIPQAAIVPYKQYEEWIAMREQRPHEELLPAPLSLETPESPAADPA